MDLSKAHVLLLTLMALLVIDRTTASCNAPLINEFQPNPAGIDPSSTTIELCGPPGMSFAGWILSIENDDHDGLGTVDRATQFTGGDTFDVNGLLTLQVPDLENPSFTLMLVETFTGSIGGTDIDTNNDGVVDNRSSFGTGVIYDAIGVPRSSGAPPFAAQFDGGTNFPATSLGSPTLAFRAGVGGAWYAVYGNSVFDATGTRVDAATFDADPISTTFGAANPITSADPPVIDPPVVNPVTIPPLTNPPATGSPVTEPTAPDPPANDPVIGGSTITMIHDIQGNGMNSPMVDKVVTVEAVVVGDFQTGDADSARNLGGFFLQEEDTDADDDLTTSEGIFVLQGSISAGASNDVSVGDVVQVTGTVKEWFGETQLRSITLVQIMSTGNNLPTAAVIDLPTNGFTISQGGAMQPNLEAFESMLVRFSQELTITEQFQLDRFNEIKLVQGDRPSTFTQLNEPDRANYTTFLENLGMRRITYDDGLDTQNFDIGSLDGFGPIYNTDTAFRMGDTISGLSGVLSYQWAGSGAAPSTWRVRSTQNGENIFMKTNPRLLPPTVGGGTHKIVSLNVLNYFTTLQDRSSVGTPCNSPSSPRGANNLLEFNRQTEKLVTAIVAMDADIIGIVEVENCFGPGGALGYLVDQINIVLGTPRSYAFVNPGSTFIGGDAIAVGFIYKTSTVLLQGTAAILIDDAFIKDPPNNRGSPKNRPALAQSFRSTDNPDTSACVTLTVNHFKSKGSGCSTDGAANDGAGNCDGVRTNAAIELTAWLESDPTAQGCSSVGIVGDLNAYAMEQPIKELENRNYVNVGKMFDANVYSYLFDGQIGTLDYFFANTDLAARVTGAAVWHINEDEADALDYNLDFGKLASYFNGSSSARNSDHSPVIVGVDLGPPPKRCRASEDRSLFAATSADGAPTTTSYLRSSGSRSLANCGSTSCNPVTQECIQGNCQCKPGYYFNEEARQCQDEDECDVSYPCPFNNTVSFCVDMDPPMRYKCGCLEGYVAVLPTSNAGFTEPVPVEFRPITCVLASEANIDECNNRCFGTGREGQICGLLADDITYDCICDTGFSSDGTEPNVKCSDDNECLAEADNNCDGTEMCVNIPGSYRCVKNTPSPIAVTPAPVADIVNTPPPTEQPVASPGGGSDGPVCLSNGATCSVGGSCCSGSCI